MRKLLLLLMLAISVYVYAYTPSSFKKDGIAYSVLTSSTVAVTYDKASIYKSPTPTYSGDIVIPTTVTDNYANTYDVVSIGQSAFSNCKQLTSISLPSSITSIEERAFYRCTSLTSIDIPDSVKTLGKEVFYECNGLTSVKIPNSVVSIGEDSFYGNDSLKQACFGSIESLCSIVFENLYSNPLYNAHDLIIDGVQVSNITIPNTVSSIGQYAFYGCNAKSVTIPYSIKSIGTYAFYSETLQRVNFPSLEFLAKFHFTSYSQNPLYYAHHLFIDGKEITNITLPDTVRNYTFAGCEGLRSVTIPSSNDTIEGGSAFYECKNLTDVIYGDGCTSTYPNIMLQYMENVYLPNSMLNVVDGTFSYCDSLKNVIISLKDDKDFSNFLTRTDIYKVFYPLFSPHYWTNLGYNLRNKNHKIQIGGEIKTDVTIPNTITEINDYAFYNCHDIKHATIPNSITKIGNYAFYGTSIDSIALPDNITTYISGYTFNSTTKVYTNVGSCTLLYLWSGGNIPYELDTNKKLNPPTISVFSTTQTTVKVRINNIYPEYKYFYPTKNDEITGNEFTINNLNPEYSSNAYVNVSKDNDYGPYYMYANYTTQPISPTPTVTNITASSISVKGSYIKGDAEVVKQEISFAGSDWREDSVYEQTGLEPNKSYDAVYRITLRNGKTYSKSMSFKTQQLALTTEEPKIITEGNVIVSAKEDNLNENETNVGFEWRRIDWTDDMTSNTHTAYLYENTIEGYIRNLNKDHFWKVRPYYQANSGNYFYGDWKTFDPTNTSYFEPTVHTYASVSVNGNNASVKGYAQRGTDNITSQGFMYWNTGSNGSSSAKAYAPSSIPSNAQKVEVKGTLMETTFSGLEYNSTYTYVAYVTTSEDETYYGDMRSFTTGDNPTGIDAVKTDASQSKYPAGIYDLNGRKLDKMRRGINIVRFEDGTVKKIIVK